MSKNPKAEGQKQAIVKLLQSNQIDLLRRRLDAGELDPALVPEVIWNVAAHPAVDLLDRWLAAGVDPNWGSMPRPMALAASRGRLPNVESLLAAGADPNIEAAFGGGPLHNAVIGGHDAVAVRLLAAGGDPTLPPGAEELAVLAAGQGMVETLRALLDHGVDVDTRGTLQPAMFSDDEETRRRSELMMKSRKSKLSPDEQTELDELKTKNEKRFEALSGPPPYRDATLLAIAYGEEHNAVVELLLERGADPETREQRVGPDSQDDELDEEPASVDEGGTDLELDGSSDDEDEEEWREPDLPDLPTLTDDESTRYEQKQVIARLRRWAKNPAFGATARLLETLAGNKAQPWGDGCGLAVHVDSRSQGGKMLRVSGSGGLMEALEMSHGPGFKALRQALGAPEHCLVMSRERAVLFPTADPLDVIAAFGVSAPNVSVGPQAILATLRDFPLRLHHVRHDMVVGFVEPVPTDLDAARDLALRYLALRPEVIFEDDAVSIVTDRLIKDGKVYLWWD